MKWPLYGMLWCHNYYRVNYLNVTQLTGLSLIIIEAGRSLELARVSSERFFVSPAEFGGWIQVGGGADEDAYGTSPRCWDSNRARLLPAHQPKLHRDSLAKDIPAHVWEWDLNHCLPCTNVFLLYQIPHPDPRPVLPRHIRRLGVYFYTSPLSTFCNDDVKMSLFKKNK